jgi:endoglucanase
MTGLFTREAKRSESIAYFSYIKTPHLPGLYSTSILKGSLMKRLSVIFIFLLLSQSVFAFLKTSGRNIINSEGQPVLLRGYGLGGWLVPEGYMLHIPGYGSPSAIRTLISDLVGEENTAAFYREYEANYVAEADIAQIAAWGLNSVRLPFNYRMLTPVDQPGVYLEEGFAVIDKTLEWCKKYKLYLILDLHCAPGGQNNGNISDSDGLVARLWTSKTNQDRTIDLWKKLAERYANEEWIGGYDLINEPVLPPGYANGALKSLLVKIIQAVREVDTNHIVFIEGNWYATDFNLLTPPFDDNMVYSFHKYWNSTAVSSIQSYLTMSSQNNVPLWLGESGENSNQWFNEVVQLCEKNNIGWCWWAHKKVDSINGVYSAPLTARYDRVLKYWSGENSKPTVDAAMLGLMEMATFLKLENCVFHPDVVDALTRPDFMQKSLPFKQHVIPGKIDAVDYDMGGNNRAYKDTRYENADNSDGWNTGWLYRNDGVDIEESGDALGPRYSVGWIDDGEWMNYTVTVEKGGIYDVEFRVASTGTSGRLALRLDGNTVVPETPIPNTGGWKTWRAITAHNVLLEKGSHVLTQFAQRGGYNLELFNFILKQETGVEQTAAMIPEEPMLEANYPNPFNGATLISFYLPRQEEIDLAVFSLDGRLVNTLMQGSLTAGRHSVIWNGKNQLEQNAASGVYFVRLKSETSQLSRLMILNK